MANTLKVSCNKIIDPIEMVEQFNMYSIATFTLYWHLFIAFQGLK